MSLTHRAMGLCWRKPPLGTIIESSPTCLLTTWELMSLPGVLAQVEVGVLQPEPLVFSLSQEMSLPLPVPPPPPPLPVAWISASINSAWSPSLAFSSCRRRVDGACRMRGLHVKPVPLSPCL